MSRIIDLMQRDFERPIEEIIKVNNSDEETVHTELTEYIATDRIKSEYREILKAMHGSLSAPTEGIGVWISGFFGSGKSSFAKNLGYVLANRTVLGTPASDLFADQVKDQKIGDYLTLLNASLPCEVFMFDVQVDRSIRTEEQIAEVMYRVLLRDLGYAEEYDLAELEIELESEGKLGAFVALCRAQYQEDWQKVRKGSQKFTRASALMHELEPKTNQSKDSWLQSVKDHPFKSLDVGTIINRCYELCAVRRPGKAFVFIIDEMGQYVARSGEKLENLRAVVEQFGKVGLERKKKGLTPAPAWIIVTAQEKLQEVYNYIASGRIDLPKLQDRFKYQIDLSPADIRQVATERVLSKTEQGVKELRAMYGHYQGLLLQNCKLERTARRTDFTEAEFVQFYPYLPHLVDLSIHIMTGIRLQPNAPKHLGGSNRTIIKQSYEMIVSDRTKLGDQETGALVTLDKVYELVEGNIPSEKQKDILDIQKSFEVRKEYAGLAVRVAKALCLMEFVRDLPRTPHNVAALLLERVGDTAVVPAVEAVLKLLKDAQFVRETDEGWKLQTAQEKNWEQEKRSYGSVKRSERNEILRRVVKEIFEASKARQYNYKSLRQFSLSLNLDGQSIQPGQVELDLISADQSEDFVRRRDETESDSRKDIKKDRLFWLFPVPGPAETLIEDFFASQKMIERYTQLSGQQSITDLEKGLLASERGNIEQVEKRLVTQLRSGLEAGVCFFQGLKYEAGDLGSGVAAMTKALCDRAIPTLYPKVELGCRPLSGNEAEEFLKAANLNNLGPVFQPGDKGLNLVTKEGTRYLPNTKAEIAQEIISYLKKEQAYGNKVTGKQLADFFSGPGYGWDLEVVRLVLAVVFRAGAVEVTHQGRRYRNYQEPQSRVPFTQIPAFRSASFAPRESIDLKTLTTAVKNLEAMLGREVDVEETAIAGEFQKVAQAEKEQALPAHAEAKALGLEGIAGPLKDWLATLDTVLASQPDDCVRMLAGEGQTLKEARDEARRAREFLTPGNLDTVRNARSALAQQFPALRESGVQEGLEEKAADVRKTLDSPNLPKQISDLAKLTSEIDAAFRERFKELQQDRHLKYGAAIQAIIQSPDYACLSEAEREKILAPLQKRAIAVFELVPYGAIDKNTGATLRSIAEDLALLPTLEAGALSQLVPVVNPAQKPVEGVEVIRLSEYLPRITSWEDMSSQDIDDALERLKEKLYSLRELKRNAIWE
jgi:hypothetical protein